MSSGQGYKMRYISNQASTAIKLRIHVLFLGSNDKMSNGNQ